MRLWAWLFLLFLEPCLCLDEALSSEVLPSAIALWTFDEDSGALCQDQSGNENSASLEGADPDALKRTAGLFGNAAVFSGTHKACCPARPDLSHLSGLSLSAWVLPRDLSGFREIFRKEDGEQRVLFSFQNDGRVLSLGLNVEGYMECDGVIAPEEVLDEQWHHCAATFDGRVMRVFLDGQEVGSLDRPGKILAGGQAPGCIGSSNGGECFQGLMDDLRIYDQALSMEQVSSLYASGLQTLSQGSQEVEETLKAVYQKASSFPETLASCRQNIIQKGVSLTPLLARRLAQELRSGFPEDYREFLAVTGTRPCEYLASPGNDIHLQLAERLMTLLTEYRPLTENQWQHLCPEERSQWDEANEIEKTFQDLKSQGDASQFSPEWIRIILEAGNKVHLRPSIQEAVAPYVKPETPETRSLSSEEARRVLERDWLFQADRAPTPDRILKEIAWARDLAERFSSQESNLRFREELNELRVLEDKASSLSQPNAEVYFKVREVKRRILFSNPVLDFDSVLFVDMPFPQGSEWPHETRHRLGYMAVPGARLMVLKGLDPSGTLLQLMPQAPLHGSFWRPDLSYDGDKVLFCFKPHNEKSFHLYEIRLDGSGLTQLTDGIYDDMDPIYLPDGHLLFSTTRGHTYVRCMPPTNAYVLARCDPDGQNIYLVSANNEPDYLASVMEDGRILYTRWEYTDKPLWRAQGLWTVNPDGTQVNTFWGNQSVWPDLMKDARNIPGTRKVMFTGSAHHNWFSGSVGIIDPDRGYNFPQGLTKVTSDVAWPESGNGPVDPIESRRYHVSGSYEAYYSPFPLNEKDFLVSAQRDKKFLLYLMDVDGNRELIYEGTHHILHALPVRPRVKPPLIADRVAWPTREERLHPKTGVLFSGNVYQGAPTELKDKARFLRVIHIDEKTYTYWHQRPYISTGPVVSMVQSDGVKRVLGTVPIEKDGSVAFQAPPGKALHFQLLDERHRALQTMRSFASLMPGEKRGCLGCHESHSRTPVIQARCEALLKDPQPITHPPWGDDTVSFPRYVQPVLDQYCGRCHQGEGKARKALDLTLRPGFLTFQEPYVTLTGHPSWGAAYAKPENPPPGFGIADTIMVEGFTTTDPAAYVTPRPMTYLSYKSRLIDIASNGKHHGVQVDDLSLQRLIAWVDTMCPYFGDEEIRQIPDPNFQGVDWLAIRPQIQNAPIIVRPGPVDG